MRIQQLEIKRCPECYLLNFRIQQFEIKYIPSIRTTRFERIFFGEGCIVFKGRKIELVAVNISGSSSIRSLYYTVYFIHDEDVQQVQNVCRSHLANANDYEIGKLTFCRYCPAYLWDYFLCLSLYYGTVVVVMHNFLNIYQWDYLRSLSFFVEVLHYSSTTVRPAGI